MTRRPRITKVLSCAAALAAGGCGTMELKGTEYFAVPSGDNTNYYRMRVWARTQLGKADYRSGWYPADAVDALFGDVSAEGAVNALAARRDIENAISASVESTTRAWLDEAAKPAPDPEHLAGLMEARRRVVAAPLPGSGDPGDRALARTLEIEFNPAAGVVTRHADEKRVFVLASNPDEVIGRIKAFAEDEKTALAVADIGTVIRESAEAEAAADEARAAVRKAADGAAATQARTSAETVRTTLAGVQDPADRRRQLLAEIDRLLATLRAQAR